MKKKVIYLLLVVCLICATILPVSAADYWLVFDDADLLTDSEEVELDAKYDEISNRHQMEVVAAVFETIGDYTPMEYADDFYDYNGYGYGDNNDGLVLIVVMDTSDWYISTCGKAITAFTDAGIDYIGEQIVPYLSDGDYYAAFDKFADLCDEFMTQYETGDPYDTHNLPKGPFLTFKTVLISLVAGIIVAIFYTRKLVKQLGTVQKKNEATNYVKEGGISVTTSSDLFLYKTVNRTAKESSSSSGGSSTHRSSSGTTHGGGGGKF